MVNSTSVSATASNHKLAMGILVVWLSLCAVLFWYFQFRHMNAFDDYWATFHGESFKENRIRPIKGYAIVMHFIDNSCPCSRFAEPHIRDLERQFGNEVEFIRFGSTENTRHPKIDFSQLNVPASPAVAIWSKDGDLAYLGPYSGGAICGQGRDFVSSTLGNLKERHNPKWFNQEAIGCLCEWPVSQEL